MLKKKIWANFQRIIELFTKKIVALQTMVLGSGIRKKPIPDPGFKKAPDPGSGSATLLPLDMSVLQQPVLSGSFRRKYYSQLTPIRGEDLQAPSVNVGCNRVHPM